MTLKKITPQSRVQNLDNTQSSSFPIPIPKKLAIRFITRNKERILINETTRQNYNHVIRLSKDNPGNSNVQSRSQPNTRGKQRQTYNNTTNHPDKTHQKSSSSWSNQQLPQEILDKIASMEQQITTLTNHVNVLQGSHQTFTEQYSSHHQQLTTIDTNIADALPLSDEYYTESGDISDTGTIENTYEAAEQDTSGQSSFILNPFNWGNKPQV
ncbi:hypothetical protein RhiirA1_477534 [Rhizophagus irregularis]|uniref:Uncharacterized protein n=1 Tax=Rhizophagus irregularis TaxID=588596 RepID=A0A2N0QTD2_9GLOM|nr:hypothetical protein RhiirA1_477534 [Rhizophagus irregularis]